MPCALRPFSARRQQVRAPGTCLIITSSVISTITTLYCVCSIFLPRECCHLQDRRARASKNGAHVQKRRFLASLVLLGASDSGAAKADLLESVAKQLTRPDGISDVAAVVQLLDAASVLMEVQVCDCRLNVPQGLPHSGGPARTWHCCCYMCTGGLCTTSAQPTGPRARRHSYEARAKLTCPSRY